MMTCPQSGYFAGSNDARPANDKENDMAKQNSPFEDFSKMFEQFKLPGLDMSAIVEARRKDIEVLVEANKASYATMQAMGAKQASMLAQAIQDIQGAAQAAVSSAGKVDPAKQTELAQTAYKKALADIQELADIATKSQAATLASITERANEHVKEFQKLLQPK